MRFALASLVGLALGLACAGGCSSSQDGGNESSSPSDNTLRKRLETKTGVTWKVDVGADGTVYAEPDGAPTRKITPSMLIADFGEQLGMAGGVLEIREGTVRDLDDGARAHEYYQMHQGISVEDGSVEVHVSKDGDIELVIGRWVHDLAGLSTTAAIAKDRAEQIALDDAKTEDAWVDRTTVTADGVESGLTIYSRGDHPLLAYRVAFDALIDAKDPASQEVALAYVIDAQSGAIVSKRNRNNLDVPIDASGKGVRGYAFPETDLKKFAATKRDDGVFTMVSAAATNLPEIRVHDASRWFGPIIESTSATAWDERAASEPTSAGNGSAVDAIYQVTRAARHFDLAHHWTAWGKTGKPIDIYVHEKDSDGTWAWYRLRDHSLHFPDAILINGKRHPRYLPSTAALDVVGHEFGHGFVDSVAPFRGPSGDGEQGALSEAFADLIGVTLAHAYAPDDKANWHFGAMATRDGKPVRDLDNPAATGTPSHVSQIRGPGEYHINAVVIDHAFRLMALGGEHVLSRVIVGGGGIGWQAFEKLLIASVKTLRPTTGFGELAWNTIRLAKRKLGIPVEPVVCSWVAVGVISARSALSEHGVDCACAHPLTGLPLSSQSADLTCCEPTEVACCKKCNDSVLGSWQGDWGKISFANVNGELRAAYTYREGVVLAKGEKGSFEACWSEAPSRKAPNIDIGAAEFTVKETRLDGRWNFRSDGRWRDDWDVTWVGPTVPPTFKWRMEQEPNISSCR